MPSARLQVRVVRVVQVCTKKNAKGNISVPIPPPHVRHIAVAQGKKTVPKKITSPQSTPCVSFKVLLHFAIYISFLVCYFFWVPPGCLPYSLPSMDFWRKAYLHLPHISILEVLILGKWVNAAIVIVMVQVGKNNLLLSMLTGMSINADKVERCMSFVVCFVFLPLFFFSFFLPKGWSNY